MTDPGLRARKQQRAREQIVEAAYALFAERGFDAVTVTDIAARAEVGRTTFFRYFGDKREVVFADEQRHAERMAVVGAAGGPPVDSLPAALRVVAEVVLAVSDDVVGDPARYGVYTRLLAAHPELADRMRRKLDHLTDELANLLTGRGADREIAALAAGLGIGCFLTAYRLAGDDATALLPALRRAFDRLHALASDCP
ncbi:TetR/AcrR family transcriptional regulator [Virgisporangium ochraceum]|uniref:TetR family transcriptional regulator n=1 Tax=Virgisporangium ochraceum TaxID=65505 RepID=A0A8J4EFL3_9ACTN|nr:TetR family transcriptional regulator [Virgisporangium ochraceum]GIJ72763.1 TetR family transcriptional regulator [Virgisporangium ochraceum]